MKLNFSNYEVLVIGDIMLDHYIMGTILRQSPEADVPIVSQSSSSIFPGGAANVAINILGLGAKVNLIGVIGADFEGEQLSKEIEKAGIKEARLIQDKNRITTRKTRVLADDQHVVRVDQENVEDLNQKISDQLLSNLNELIKKEKIDIVILQDYNKGLFSQYVITNIISTLKEAGIPFVVDPKKKNIFEYQGAQILKPNLSELKNAFDPKEVDLNENWKSLAKRLYNRCQPKLLLVTLGADGIWSFDGKNEYHHPAHKIDMPDVCGAGDAVISMAALAECKKLGNIEILKLCNEAGAVACQRLGVRAVTLNDINSLQSSLLQDNG